MAMAMPVEKPKSFGVSARRLVGSLRPERALIAAVAALGAVSVALSVLGPRVLGHVTNIVFEGISSRRLPAGVTQAEAVASLRAKGDARVADILSAMTLRPGQGIDFGALNRWVSVAVLLFLTSSAFMWAQNYLMAGVVQRTGYRLREEVDAKLNRLPLRYFDNSSRGDLLSRVTNDIDNVTQTLQQTLSQALTALLTVIGVLVMMLSISPLLALVSLVVLPVSGVVAQAVARRSQPQFAEQWRWTGILNGHVEEMHTGHELVKVYGRRRQAVETFAEANDELYSASFRAQFISGIIQPLLGLLSNLNYAAICVIGGWRVTTGSLSLGDVQAFIQYSRQFSMPITQLASVANLLQSGVASAERVYELLDADEEPALQRSPATLPVSGPARGRVAFEHIAFRYAPDVPLIDDLSVRVEQGSTVAIVGPTGAGKTTLVNLLMRFYDVDAGRITLSGVDIRDLRRDELRRSFGMVLQDTWLFRGTIRDNIAYGATGATDEQVLAAARAAYVDRFVHHIPDGYLTVIDDEASNLSAGEKQLVTIARAFLADPPILILDEATSSVDTRTEVLVQAAMARLRHGRKSFVIAHRLSTIRDADTILVMDAGAVVEQGTHEELLASGGVYARLHASQFEGAVT